MYINQDKSPKTSRIEAGLRKLQRSIQAISPGIGADIKVDKPRLCFQWKGANIASLQAPQPDLPVEIVWEPQLLARTGLDKAAVSEHVNSAFAGPPDMQSWIS